MADKRAKRIADLTKTLRVKPGAKVNLAKDFDPGYKAGFVKKKAGRQLLRAGIVLLADHRRRLAARDTYRVPAGSFIQLSRVSRGVQPDGDRRWSPEAYRLQVPPAWAASLAVVTWW